MHVYGTIVLFYWCERSPFIYDLIAYELGTVAIFLLPSRLYVANRCDSTRFHVCGMHAVP